MKVSVSLPREMVTWIERRAARSKTTFSGELRSLLLPAYDRRSAAKMNSELEARI